MNEDLIKYYKERAKEYEKIYLKPERQKDLNLSTSILQERLANKNVLEIACGTGFWTEKIAQTAASIFATDINESVIEIAKQKHYSKNHVTFDIADLFDRDITIGYESLFGGFILSHILLQDIDKFFIKVNQSVMPGGTVVFIDNNFVKGGSHPITQTDEVGNTYQKRTLESGSTHLVLKNFLTEPFLEEKLSGIATGVEFFNLEYYWILCYKLNATKAGKSSNH